jgi:hypothetical protein
MVKLKAFNESYNTQNKQPKKPVSNVPSFYSTNNGDGEHLKCRLNDLEELLLTAQKYINYVYVCIIRNIISSF